MKTLNNAKSFFLHFYSKADIDKFYGIMTPEEMLKKSEFDQASTRTRAVYKVWSKQYERDPKHPVCPYNKIYPRHGRLPFLLRADTGLNAFSPPEHVTIEVRSTVETLRKIVHLAYDGVIGAFFVIHRINRNYVKLSSCFSRLKRGDILWALNNKILYDISVTNKAKLQVFDNDIDITSKECDHDICKARKQ